MEKNTNHLVMQLSKSSSNRRFTLEIKKHFNVCSVYIDGGLNLVTWNNTARVYIPGLDDDLSSWYISDGERYNTCISTNVTDTICAKFEAMNKIYRIAIYPNNPDVVFYVNCTNHHNESVFIDTITTHTRGPSFVHLNSYVHKIEITTKGHGLSLCEVEIFGSADAVPLPFNPDDYVLVLPSPVTEKNLFYIFIICVAFILILSQLENTALEGCLFGHVRVKPSHQQSHIPLGGWDCSTIVRKTNILSLHDLLALKPACSSRRIPPIPFLILCNKTLQKIFPGTDRRLMPLQFSQTLRSPFLANLIVIPRFQESRT
ncbi:uncharacterized protein LOC131939394 [Physella acuta]|uniref:uncharacterized protein LOC131939394 n=1 Tax=Physella acuta TaxID=109671 RepID=UPI0027DB5F82|nr:uncharacterized protein LOC131939394 [Physella acuta]